VRSTADLIAFIESQPDLLAMLRAVAALALPDGWIAAGAVRNRLWNHLSGAADIGGDVDVVYFDPARANHDTDVERALAHLMPDIPWSARNQALMHLRNGDPAYRSTEEALCHWPETATAVAARLRQGQIEVLAPFGVDDLFARIIRPTPAMAAKPGVFRQRLEEKRWTERWSGIRVACGM
jgi:hypothetical protein